MDSPFFPALITFGPFFVILFVSAFLRRDQQRVRVRPVQVAAALAISAVIGVAGVVAVLLRA